MVIIPRILKDRICNHNDGLSGADCSPLEDLCAPLVFRSLPLFPSAMSKARPYPIATTTKKLNASKSSFGPRANPSLSPSATIRGLVCSDDETMFHSIRNGSFISSGRTRQPRPAVFIALGKVFLSEVAGCFAELADLFQKRSNALHPELSAQGPRPATLRGHRYPAPGAEICSAPQFAGRAMASAANTRTRTAG